MNWFSVFAMYFIIWWTVLFAVLPFSLRTQDDEGESVLGTHSSAPRGPHLLRAMLRTTVVSIAVYAVFYLITRVFGLTFDDLPRIIPDFH